MQSYTFRRLACLGYVIVALYRIIWQGAAIALLPRGVVGGPLQLLEAAVEVDRLGLLGAGDVVHLRTCTVHTTKSQASWDTNGSLENVILPNVILENVS